MSESKTRNLIFVTNRGKEHIISDPVEQVRFESAVGIFNSRIPVLGKMYLQINVEYYYYENGDPYIYRNSNAQKNIGENKPGWKKGRKRK